MHSVEFSTYNILDDVLASPDVSYGKCVYKNGVLMCNPNSSCSYKLTYNGGTMKVNGLKVQSNISVDGEDGVFIDGRFDFKKIRYKLRVKYYSTLKDNAGVVIEYANGVCDNIMCYPYYDSDKAERGYIDYSVFNGAGEAVASVILTIYNDSDYFVDIRNLGIYRSETTEETIERLGGSGGGGGGGPVTSPRFIGFINGTADVMIETTEGVRNIWQWSANDTKITEQNSGHTIEVDWDFEM